MGSAKNGPEDVQKQLKDLTDKYQLMCEEMKIISKHVLFLEQKLTKGDGKFHRKKRENDQENETSPEVSDGQNRRKVSPGLATDDQLSTTSSPSVNDSDDSLIVAIENNERFSDENENRDPNTGPEDKSQSCPTCDCNLLRRYSCPMDENLPLEDQYALWSLHLDLSWNPFCFGSSEAAPETNRRFNRQHRNILHDKTSIQELEADPSLSSMNLTQIDEMEHSLVEEETTYATCDVIANRHISKELQQDIRGRINLWQRSDGNGPLSLHIKLTGFSVRNGRRKRRETILMPVSTKSNGTSPNATSFSFEHALHVHASPDLSETCQSTGPHFNPTNMSHGSPMDSVRHVGDLGEFCLHNFRSYNKSIAGNIRVDERGNIDSEYSFPYVSLIGKNSIIGKSLVVSY